MSRLHAVLSGALLLFPGILAAEDAQTVQELRDLKQLMEQQMKRIDELTVEVGRLHQSVEAQRAASAPLPPAPGREAGGPPPFSGFGEMRPQPARADAAKPERPVAEVPKVEAPKADAPKPETPKAEPFSGSLHTVAKGETLTSIAKQHNIPLAELQKANKDINDRKLQIGQTLNVPAPAGGEPKPNDPTHGQ